MRDDEDLQTFHLLAKIGDGLLELAFLRISRLALGNDQSPSGILSR